MKEKKIAIVSDAVYPFNKGGKEKRIHEISTRLAAQGYDVTIYCMKWWKGEKTIIRDGVNFNAISPYYPLYAKGRRSIKEAILFALHCFKLITKDFDIIEIDCVPHFQLFTTKLVCLLKRKRMIVSWHEVWGKEYWKTYLGSLGIFAYWIEKMSVKLPDIIISVSEHTTMALRKEMGVKKEIVTIPHGLDIEAITKNLPATRTSDIVFAGRLLTHKHVDVLLRGVKILEEKNPNVKLLIVGDGPERENLEKLSLDLGIRDNVSFLGFLEDENELYRIMRASRVFVLPSTREGFGIVVLEANACGLPVVTINHEQNAAKELIVHNENGKLSALTPDDLAHAIEDLFANKKSFEVYLKHAEKYNWDRLISDIHNVYAI